MRAQRSKVCNSASTRVQGLQLVKMQTEGRTLPETGVHHSDRTGLELPYVCSVSVYVPRPAAPTLAQAWSTPATCQWRESAVLLVHTQTV